jgi:hypothetical protein
MNPYRMQEDPDMDDHQRTMQIIKLVARTVLGVVALITVSAYGCERLDSQATANKPPCKVYSCSDK